MYDISIFEWELSKIKNPNIKEFTIKSIEQAPEYFWSVAASSSGRYHPKTSLGEGGLIRHTKSETRIGIELLSLEMFNHYTDDEKDIIVSALLLHDSYKHGINGSKATITEHPLVAVEQIKSNKEICSLIDDDILNKLLDGIASHMGSWNYDYKLKK